MLTGSLQIKNDKYYAMLNLYVNGKRKPKWIPLGLPVRGNKRAAELELCKLITKYENENNAQKLPEGAKRPARRLSSPVVGDGEADNRAGDLPEL